jgi:glycosyltransferase involved in cell wall biosynthesis
VSDGRPEVSVVIPARNEAADIERCLRAVLDQRHPSYEVIVVDGASTDETAAIARRVLADSGIDGTVVTNITGGTPGNLNLGMRTARGEILCRVDARSLVPPDYLERCAAVLRERPDVAVVGGAQVAVARSAAARDVGIARALNNRYGMGLARYRRGAPSGPSDTVYLGSFRLEQLVAAGGWDEAFATNQDFELNRRMRAVGQVWFEAGLDVGYLPRSGIRSLFDQYQRFGRWKVRYWRSSGDRPQPRQLVLLGLPVVAVAAGLAALMGPPRLRASLLAGGALAGGALELAGPTGPPGPPAAHLWSLAASAAVAAGWTAGVWAAAVGRDEPS